MRFRLVSAAHGANDICSAILAAGSCCGDRVCDFVRRWGAGRLDGAWAAGHSDHWKWDA